MSTRKSSSGSSGERRARRSTKFIPNLTQLKQATKELPDPDLWPEASYLCPVEVEGRQRTIKFTLKSIHRGEEQATRWIYEGKLLIRKRDN